MTARVYDFPLPVDISGVQDAIGISELKSADMWDKIPTDLQQRMEAGAGLFGSGVSVTASELDKVPDDVWEFVASKLGLKWHTRKS